MVEPAGHHRGVIGVNRVASVLWGPFPPPLRPAYESESPPVYDRREDPPLRGLPGRLALAACRHQAVSDLGIDGDRHPLERRPDQNFEEPVSSEIRGHVVAQERDS